MFRKTFYSFASLLGLTFLVFASIVFASTEQNASPLENSAEAGMDSGNGAVIDLEQRLISDQPCQDGLSAQAFPCLGVDMASRLDLKQSGLEASRGNDIWGWTDASSGREFALMGMDSKLAVVEVTNPLAPIHWGDLPTQTYNSTWRDMKVYKGHVFVVSEAYAHGLQVLDLRPLLEMETPAEPLVFENTAFYGLFGSAHNIFINEDTGYAYVVGSDTCDAGIHVVDIRTPNTPVFSTCIDKQIFEPVRDLFAIRPLHGEDYTHDVQCVVYKGPDARYHGREICFCSNADTVNIVDVTDKANPQQISVKSYNGLGYTHQGWLTEDHKYFLLGDELDEAYNEHNTRTLIWDMSNLQNPLHFANYEASTKAIDHNLYVKGSRAYQANYDAGLRVLDLSEIAEGKLSEMSFFDTEPTSDQARFLGAWSVFPFFQSGSIVLSNISGHLFVLQE